MKTLAFAGIAGSDVGLLNKQLAALGRSLDPSWSVVGVDADPDLVIVDLSDFAGRVARIRALDQGFHFAVLADAGADTLDAVFVLQRPLPPGALADLLDRVAAIGAPARRDHGEPARVIPINRPAAVAAAIPSTPVEATRAAFAAPRRSREVTDFAALLQRGPMLIQREGLPALALDPAAGVYHASGNLSDLEPYFLERVSGRECRALGAVRLADLRLSEPAQPLLRLTWLGALLRSNGCLGSHLDPGGTYRLQRWLSVDGDYRKPFRIAAMMLRPTPLHQIAGKADAPLDEVVDVVNAYDALGWLEWTPRRSRHDVDAEAAADATPSGKESLRLLAAALLVR